MTPDALMQSITATFAGISNVNVGTCSLLDAVYTDFGFDTAARYAKVQIPISVPVGGGVVKTSGMTVPTNTYNSYSLNHVDLSLDTELHYGVAIPNIDNINTELQVQNTLVDPATVAIGEAANGCIAAILNSTYFPVNPVVPTTGSLITTAQFIKGGRTTLIKQKVAGVYDPNFMTLVMHPTVHGSVCVDDAWTKQLAVGDTLAQQYRLTGNIPVAFGTKMAVDQQMTATGTDPNQTYTSAYLSKYAIACATRPVPAGDPMVCRTRYVMWKGIMIRIELSYLGKDGAYYLNVDAVMGVKPVRTEQCVIFSTAE